VEDVRVTKPLIAILAAMVGDPGSEHDAVNLVAQTNVAPGSIYHLLARLELAGWVDSRWESIDPSEEGRPRRRLYRLTPGGLSRAKAELAEIQQLLKPAGLLLDPPFSPLAISGL